MKDLATHSELAAFVCGPATLNKFVVLVKEKWDPRTNSYMQKRRLIMDSTRFSVTDASNKENMAIMVSGACSEAMRLLDTACPGEHLEMLVLSTQEEFWNMPLHAKGREYYCGKLAGGGRPAYMCCMRTVQGSCGAPLSWAIVFSRISRCLLITM